MANLIFKDQPGNWRTNDFPSVTLTKISWDTAPNVGVAYVFFGHVNIDFDGSPTAYGPPGIKPDPDDDLGNAWSVEDGWFGVAAFGENDALVKNGTVVIDKKSGLLKKGKYPVIQQAKFGDPKPGYYVSTTPNVINGGPWYRQSSQLDASKYAFGALSGRLEALGFSLGDYGLAIRHDEVLYSGFYFADKGAYTYALGECSHKVGLNLGGTGRGNHFNNNFPVSFIVFPKSAESKINKIIPTLSDDQLKASIKSPLRKLAAADNFDELPQLMGFNEIKPSGKPQGLSKLEAFRSHRSRGKPKNYDNIVQALRNFGWTPIYPAPTYQMALPD
jgi:hypothetical protein